MRDPQDYLVSCAACGETVTYPEDGDLDAVVLSHARGCGVGATERIEPVEDIEEREEQRFQEWRDDGER